MDQVESLLNRIEVNPNDLLAIWELEEAFPAENVQNLIILLKNTAGAAAKDGKKEYAARLCLEGGRISGIKLKNQQFGSAFLMKAAKLSQKHSDIYREAQLLKLAVTQDFERLQEFFPKVIEQTSNNPELQARLYIRMGNFLENPDFFDDPKGAFEAYEYAGRLDPNSCLPWIYFQSLADRKGDQKRYLIGLLSELNISEEGAPRVETLKLAVVDAAMSNHDLALPVIRDIAQKNPNFKFVREVWEQLEPTSSRTTDAKSLETDTDPTSSTADGLTSQSASIESSPFEPVEEESEQVQAQTPSPEATFAPVSEVEAVEEPQVVAEEDTSPEQTFAEEPTDPEVQPVSQEQDSVDNLVTQHGEAVVAEPEPVAQGVIDQLLASKVRWERRVGQHLKDAESLNGDDAVTKFVRAFNVTNRHNGSVETFMTVWQAAVARKLDADLYERVNTLLDDKEFWNQAYQITTDPYLRGQIALINLQDVNLAKESGNDPKVAQLLEDYAAGCDNWRKAQREFKKRFENLDEETGTYKLYWLQADLAYADRDDDREIDALRRLERSVDLDGRVKSRLKRAYGRTENWQLYVTLLKKEIEKLDESEKGERADLLREQVVIYRDRIPHDSMLVNTYKEVLEIDPEDIDAIDALIVLYEKLNRASDLVSMLQAKAELVETPEEKIQILTEIATLFNERFRNKGEATKAFESILEIDPKNNQAIEFLSDIYAQRREWEKLIELKKRTIATLESQAEQVAALKEVAQFIASKIRDTGVIIELWYEVLQLDPDDLDALNTLEQLYEQARDYENLALILDLRVAHAETVQEQLEIFQKQGMLFSNQLNDIDRAIEAWSEAIALDPTDAKNRKSLERLLISAERWDDLEKFYAQSDNYDPSELVRLLETLAGTAKQQSTKVDLLTRSARIWREELQEIGRAERSLNRVLDIEPNNAGAAIQLEPIYLEQGRYEELPAILEVIIKGSDDKEVRRNYQLKLAKLYESELTDKRKAFDWYAQAFLSTPETDNLEVLEASAEEVENYSGLVSVYKKALTQELTLETEVRLRHHLARTLFEKLEAYDDALVQYDQILEKEPENQDALNGKAQIFKAAHRWNELNEVNKRQLELVSDPNRRVLILQEMGEIALHQAQNQQQAATYFNSVLDLDPDYVPALHALRHIYENDGSYDALVKVSRKLIALYKATADNRGGAVNRPVNVEHLFSAESGGEIAPIPHHSYTDDELDQVLQLHYTIGVVSKEHLKDEDSAISHLVQVLHWRPDFIDAAVELEVYLNSRFHGVTVAKTLANVYELHGAWEKLIESLGIQYDEAPQSRQEEILEKIGDIYLEELGSPTQAYASFAQLLKLRPDSLVAREKMERIANEIGNWSSVVTNYETAIEKLNDNDLLKSYYYALGSIYSLYLNKPDEAQSWFEKALAFDPDSDRALDALLSLFYKEERWIDLNDVLEKKLSKESDPDAIRNLTLQAALLWEEKLDDRPKAIELYQKLLLDDPRDKEVLQSVGKLFEEEEQWADRVDNLERLLELAQPQEQHDLQNRLATVLAEHQDNPERAVDLFEQVLHEDPENEYARQSLENLMQTDDYVNGRVSRILAPYYQERQEWYPYVKALEVEAATADDDETRVKLLHQVTDLYLQELNDPQSAFNAAASALRYDLNNASTLNSLYTIAQSQNAYPQLVEAFEHLAQDILEVEARRELLRRAAAIYHEVLEDTDQAIDKLKEVIEIQPDDLETLNDLEALYHARSDWENLVEVIASKVDLVSDETQKIELLASSATLYDDLLAEPLQAIDAYNRILMLDPRHEEALSRLQKLYQSEEMWDELLGIYQRRVELANSDAERVEIYSAIARLYREKLEQPFEAIETFKNILSLDIDQLDAWQQLDELLVETEQWAELLPVLESRIELRQTDQEWFDYKYRMARIQETELFNVPDAISIYQEILSVDPSHSSTREALEQLIERGDHAVEAGQVLSPVYEQLQQWDPLINVYRLLIEAASSPEQKLDLYNRVIILEEEAKNDQAAAFETALQAFFVDPLNLDSFATLERIAVNNQAWQQLIDRLDDYLAEITDFQAIRVTHLRIARILEDEVADVEGAIERYQKVLDVEPDDQTAISSLDRLYQREGRWEALADILQARSQNTTDPNQLLELRLRLGNLYRSALDDPQQAIDTYQEILYSDAENQEAIQALEQMLFANQEADQITAILEPHFRERGEYERLINLYVARLETVENREDAYEIWLQLATIFETDLQDRESALGSYGKALVEKPQESHLIPQILQIAEEQGLWDNARSIFIEVLSSGNVDPEDAVELYAELGKIQKDRFQAYDEAEQAFLKLLEFDENHVGALKALDEIYVAKGDWGRLAHVLEKRVEELYDEELLVELKSRLAELYQFQLGEQQKAIETYQSILEVDPTNELSLDRLGQLFYETQNWAQLYQVYERQSENTYEPEVQIEYYARMAQLADEVLDRPDDAVDLWNRVVSIQPENLVALENLRRLYLRDGRWDELVNLLETEERLVQDFEQKVEINRHLAQIWDAELRNEDQATLAWNQVLNLVPNDYDALEALHRLYANEPNYDALAQTVYSLIQHPRVDDPYRLELWREVAKLQSEMLFQSEMAIEAWMQVLQFVPQDREAIDQLENLLAQEGRWEETAQVLERKAQLLETTEEKTEQFLRIAQIYQNQLGDVNRAADSFKFILEVDPHNEDAASAIESIYLQEATPDAYTKLADHYLDRSELYRGEPEEFLEARRRAARVYEETLQYPEGAFLVLLSSVDHDTKDDQGLIGDLERLAAVTGQWPELVGHFDNMLQGAEANYDAARLHKLVGRWQAEHLPDQRDMAVYHFQVAYNIDPEDIETVEQLEVLYRDLQAWHDLANILQRRIEITPDPEEKISLYRKLGELYEFQLQALDEAIEAYAAIIAIEPLDLNALESLERIYAATQRYQELVEIKRQKTGATYDPDQLIAIRSEIAEIQENCLQDIEATIDTYREILTVDQMYQPALAQLERLYGSLESWHELADIYEQQVQTNPDPQSQVDTYLKQASLFENQFQDAEKTIEAYQNILTIVPDDLTAIENLERIHYAFEQWFELVDMYQRHATVADLDDVTRAQVYANLGHVQASELQDINAAIESYQSSLQYVREQPEVLEELASLYSQNASWDDVTQSLWAKLDLIQDPAERVDTLYRIAWVNDAEIHNDQEAARVYEMALAEDPRHGASLNALVELYLRHQQPQQAIAPLVNAERATKILAEKAEYLAKVGQIYQDHLGDRINAAHYFEQAFESNPDAVGALEPLLDIEIEEKRWERALTLLERLFSNERVRTPEEDHKRYFQLALAYENLNKKKEALSAYRQAYEYNPHDIETLRGLGAALYEDNQNEKALSVFQSLLDNYIDEMGDDEIVDVLHKSGLIYEQNGNLQAAIRSFHRTLEFNAHHIPSIQKLIEVLDAQQQWTDAIEYRRYLLEAVTDDFERFAILRKIGQIFENQLYDPVSATEAYLQALDYEPNSIVILRQLLKIYQEQHQHPESVEMLKRMIDIEDDSKRRAKFYYTIGLIYRDKLQDQVEAVNNFELALDNHIKMLEAFEAIDRIHTERRDWKELERSYRRMLKRIAKNSDGADMTAEQVLLWTGLGEIYRSRLDHLKSAIQSYEMVVELNPSDQKARLILAELYELSGDNPTGAITQHKELIKINNFRTESYRALWKAYMQNKEYDKAWCMAGALVFLNSASAQEKAFYEKYLGTNLKMSRGTITNEMWKLLYHPTQDLMMSAINQTIATGLIGFFSRPIEEWGVHKKKSRLDENTIFHRIFTYCVKAESTVAPRLFLRSDQALGMRNMNADPPAFIVGGDMVQSKTDRELAFTIAKQVCLSRPENYLASIGLPTEYLKAFFMTAMDFADPSLNLIRAVGEVGQQVMGEFQKMPPTIQLSLQKQVKAYLNLNKNPNLSAWMTAVDHTSNRVGLLLCGDLQKAADAIKSDPNQIGKASVKEKVSELVLFAISDEYFRMRELLGLSIEEKK